MNDNPVINIVELMDMLIMTPIALSAMDSEHVEFYKIRKEAIEEFATRAKQIKKDLEEMAK